MFRRGLATHTVKLKECACHVLLDAGLIPVSPEPIERREERVGLKVLPVHPLSTARGVLVPGSGFQGGLSLFK